MGLSFASVMKLFWGGLSFHILQNGGQLCVFVLGVFNDLGYPYGSRTVATYNVMMNYLYAPPTKVGGI
jgi:hypothetical protein